MAPTAPLESASPAASPRPSNGSFEASPVQSPETALAAVIEEYPRYEDYPLRPGSEPGESPDPVFGGGLIGQSRWVIARDVAAGIELTFVTGSGDCPSGCIEHAYDTYLVEPDGTVTFICSEGDAPSADAPDATGRSVDQPFEPCADVPR